MKINFRNLINERSIKMNVTYFFLVLENSLKNILCKKWKKIFLNKLVVILKSNYLMKCNKRLKNLFLIEYKLDRR